MPRTAAPNTAFITTLFFLRNMAIPPFSMCIHVQFTIIPFPLDQSPLPAEDRPPKNRSYIMLYYITYEAGHKKKKVR